MQSPKVQYIPVVPLPADKTEVLFRVDGETYAGIYLDGMFQTVNHEGEVMEIEVADVDAWVNADAAYLFIQSQEQS